MSRLSLTLAFSSKVVPSGRVASLENSPRY